MMKLMIIIIDIIIIFFVIIIIILVLIIFIVIFMIVMIIIIIITVFIIITIFPCRTSAENPCQVSVTGPKLVQTGAEVILHCSTVGRCQYSPEWRSSGPGPASSEVSDTQGVKTAQLSFKADWSHDGVEFSCWPSPSNDACASRSITLAVEYPPKNTSVSVSPSGSVLEGSSVTLTCSSNANPAVQNYTWYKVNGTEMNTVGTGQNLTFNVTESSGSEQYYCEAQNEHGKENSTTVQLNVIYMPQISGSGSCSRTAAEISCSCESRGNPSPSMEWRVSGLRVTNSTDRVIREEQLGNTGLRSSLTMDQSQGDTPTLSCVSTNTLGSSSLQLHLPSPQQHSGFGSTNCITSLLIGAAAGAGAMMMICLIMQHILK
ncbi:sialic acid-binding Ig-like lectin 10 [Anguilla rostrata]|uniref:sialic acid-binding Ig-like lectin 10 n=1 Tax=Anguilla rostrata TaxID=7938 RepID=UPI0030CDBDDE